MKARKAVDWNLRRLRVSKLLTLEDLADAAGSHPVYLARLERGEVNVSIDRLERLSKVLGARLTDLFVEPAAGEKPPRPLHAGRKPTRSKPKKKPAV